MKISRMRRKIRCLFKYGPNRCPHIERHSRRPRRREDDDVADVPRISEALPVVKPAHGRHSAIP